MRLNLLRKTLREARIFDMRAVSVKVDPRGGASTAIAWIDYETALARAFRGSRCSAFARLTPFHDTLDSFGFSENPPNHSLPHVRLRTLENALKAEMWNQEFEGLVNYMYIDIQGFLPLIERIGETL